MFCNQFNSCVYSLKYSLIHNFLYGAATINFTFSFYANLDYNNL
jgi:hypothetical protein